MNDQLHFEQIWEQSEALFTNDNSPHSSILMELRAKIALYEALSNNDNIPPKDKIQLKHYSFGHILSTLTHLSYADNINVFEALNLSISQAGR